MQNVIEQISQCYPSFSRSQKKIADFIVKNPQEACFLSLKDFSDKVNTTEKTIINFTKKCGFDSFTALKKELQSYIAMKLTPDEKVIKAVSTIRQTHQDFIRNTYQMDLDSITSSFDCLNFTNIYRAAELIQKAENIYFASHNISQVVTDFLMYRIGSLGLGVYRIDIDSEQELPHQILHMKPTDVLVVASFPRYYKNLVAASHLIKDRGIPIIAITDSLTSPIANNSNICFACATDTTVFYNSYTGPMVIANILASTIAMNMEKQVLENKKAIKKIQQDLKNLVDAMI